MYSSATTDGFPHNLASDDTKFVAILRNPIDFLFSFYTTEIRRHFREINRDVSFDRFVHNPEDLYADARGMEATRVNLERWRPLFARRPYFNPAEFSIATALVCYVVFIKEWASKIPADRFLVLSFSDLRDETQETMDTVFDFLGLSSFQVSDIKARNVGKYEGETVSPEAASYISTKGSPPTPHPDGTVTHSTAAVAIAASKALPPSARTRAPAVAATGEMEQTMPPLE